MGPDQTAGALSNEERTTADAVPFRATEMDVWGQTTSRRLAGSRIDRRDSNSPSASSLKRIVVGAEERVG
jgi:hypothetical protein